MCTYTCKKTLACIYIYIYYPLHVKSRWQICEKNSAPLRGAAKEDGQLASQRQGKVFTARFEGFNRPWRQASHESDP